MRSRDPRFERTRILIVGDPVLVGVFLLTGGGVPNPVSQIPGKLQTLHDEKYPGRPPCKSSSAPGCNKCSA